MNSLPDEDICKFLKDNIQPLDDNAYGLGYRASATLKDGTFLPCVIFRNPATLIDLAMRRFKEERSGKSIFSKSSGLGYREIVKTFVAAATVLTIMTLQELTRAVLLFHLTYKSRLTERLL